MAYTDDTPQVGAPLGVGDIVSSSFSILLGKFGIVLAMTLVPTVIGFFLSSLLVGWDVTLGLADPDFLAPNGVLMFALSTLVSQVVYAFSTALLVQVAYDAKLGRAMRVNEYVSRAIAAAVPITVLGLAMGIMAGIASIALILPGLWVYAVFSVMAPAVVIERAGFGGLGRSAKLTKEYRWPILGALIIVMIIAIALGFGIGFVIAALNAGLVVNIALLSVVTAVGYGLGGIAIALIYARLRELKDGVSVDQIASVFD